VAQWGFSWFMTFVMSGLSTVSRPCQDARLQTDIRTWNQNVEQHASEGVHRILIGNKCDWDEKRVVTEEQGKALAEELGVPFMETSAKSNINVEEAFFSLARYSKSRRIDC
jgi:GTPase SAR1 family protein